MKNRKDGRFISLESIDGGGKTTNIKFIAEYLTEQGFDVVTTRDPGGTPAGEHLRQAVLTLPMSPTTELLLFSAIRQELVDMVILPAMGEGKVVISDRYSDSTYAYQCVGRGLRDEVAYLEPFVGYGVMPHYTLLLDISLDESLRRVNTRANKDPDDRFENEAREFKQKLYEAYQARAKAFPERIHCIPAEDSIDVVRSRIKIWLDTVFIPANQHLVKEAQHV